MTVTEVVPVFWSWLVAFGVRSALLGGQGSECEGRRLVGRRVFPVAATVAVDGTDGRLWTAQVAGGDIRVEGLFAWGDSFDEARERVAQVVLLALEGDGAAFDAVQVFATTRKTYSAVELRAGRR